MIQFYGLSDVGRQRTNNEDAFVVEQLDERTVLAVAIDGVGGYEGGEVAAEIAQTKIPRYLHDFRNGERLELLKQAVVCANNAIFARRQVDTARPSMSCVLTSALIDSGRKVIDMVHVGDTRMYQFHHGELRKLSHDHSLIGYREEIGDLTEEQAMHHPQRNVISRDVGSAKHEVADRDFLEAGEFPLLPNSIFLLCSDGLTDLVISKQIIAILEKNLSLKQKAQALIDAANEAGGKDNVTVVLVEYVAEEKEQTPSSPSDIKFGEKEEKYVQPPQPTEPKTEENNELQPENNTEIMKKCENKRFLISLAITILMSLITLGYIYCAHQESRDNQHFMMKLLLDDEKDLDVDEKSAPAELDTINNNQEHIKNLQNQIYNLERENNELRMEINVLKQYLN